MEPRANGYDFLSETTHCSICLLDGTLYFEVVTCLIFTLQLLEQGVFIFTFSVPSSPGVAYSACGVYLVAAVLAASGPAGPDKLDVLSGW
jgi:hypothetical protein